MRVGIKMGFGGRMEGLIICMMMTGYGLTSGRVR
jgi:hypothetical protein